MLFGGAVVGDDGGGGEVDLACAVAVGHEEGSTDEPQGTADRSRALVTPGAVLTSSHLKELGWTRTRIDAIWRACPMVILPGTRRPVLRVEDFLAYLEEHTYRNEQPRVVPAYRPLAGPSPTDLARRRSAR